MALASAPDRTPEDKALDAGRKPAEMLYFFDLSPGQKVAELGAGGGWTSELLARAVGPTGKVWVQNHPSWVEKFLKKPLADRFARPVMANAVRVDQPFETPLPAGATDLDAVITHGIYHDTVWMNVDRLKMNQAVLAALKPGGFYYVVDTSAAAGRGVADAKTLHRLDEQVVRDEVVKAGFRFVGESHFGRNPADLRNWNASPGEAGERRGTGDRFALRFAKPYH